jgi:hypothetical protein
MKDLTAIRLTEVGAGMLAMIDLSSRSADDDGIDQSLVWSLYTLLGLRRKYPAVAGAWMLHQSHRRTSWIGDNGAGCKSVELYHGQAGDAGDDRFSRTRYCSDNQPSLISVFASSVSIRVRYIRAAVEVA